MWSWGETVNQLQERDPWVQDTTPIFSIVPLPPDTMTSAG